MQDSNFEKTVGGMLDQFTLGLVVTVGLLATGIVYIISSDKLSEETPYDTITINALKNMDYGEFRDNDTHYERIDREKKYYGSMIDIESVGNDGSIKITFDANYFQRDKNGESLKSQSQDNLEFIATINENETFVVGCNLFSLQEDNTKEGIPVKQIHVLRYEGITEKEGIHYYGFDHEAGYISDDIECKFPDMIQHSLAIGLDVSNTDFYGEVWDHDWQ